MKRIEFMKRTFAVAALALLVCGCGGGQTQHKTFMVKGLVTFNGEPVTEGLVVFEDKTNGRTGEGEIAGDGLYRVRVGKGSYAVRISPPMVEIDEGPDSPPSIDYKKMANIPDKYRGQQSGFIVDVTGDMDSGADLAMTGGK